MFKDAPSPHEDRFSSLPRLARKANSGNLLRMDKALGREVKRKRGLGDYTTPSYNPKYDLVSKRTDIGTPSFFSMQGRKMMITEPECKNIYDTRAIMDSLMTSNTHIIPDFDKMNGRETLNKFKVIS